MKDGVIEQRLFDLLYPSLLDALFDLRKVDGSGGVILPRGERAGPGKQQARQQKPLQITVLKGHSARPPCRSAARGSDWMPSSPGRAGVRDQRRHRGKRADTRCSVDSEYS